MEMIESFATMLLADSFWSRWEDNDLAIDLLTQEERNQFRQSYAGPGCEIVQGMQDGICDLEIDLQSFLPLEMTQKIVDSVNESWKGKYSVEQLHEYCERASHRLILGQVGHGVDADDDTDIAEMFKELGIEIPSGYYESPYEQAENLVRKVEETLAHKYGHEWVQCSTNKYDVLILVQNIGNGQAWFSVKATDLSTFKSAWVTNKHCIVSMTGSSKWEDEFADWEMPLEEAIIKKRMLEARMTNPFVHRSPSGVLWFQEWFDREVAEDPFDEYEWK